MFTYAEPVTAVIFAAVFLAEPLGWVTAVGGAAVVAAGILVARMAPTTGMEAPAPVAEGPPDAAASVSLGAQGLECPLADGPAQEAGLEASGRSSSDHGSRT